MKSRPYPRYAFFDLLYSEEQLLSNQKPNVDPAVFKDKIVFVGVTAAGLFDVFATPFAGGRMPGIQVHAAVADDVLSNRFLRPAVDRVRIVDSPRVGHGDRPCRHRHARMVGNWRDRRSAIAVFGWATTRLFAAGYWINLSQPVLAASVALFGGVAYQYFVEGREKRKMKRLFGQYVSKDVLRTARGRPELARLGGQRREMTVLFSDIRGFTTVTEAAQPEEIVGMLNEYFTRMVEIVFRASRDARQVRRRHGDGAVRRAARRSRTCRPRGRGGARHGRGAADG